jgi:hypothetical protein
MPPAPRPHAADGGRLGARLARLNPSLLVDLDFWALWHCRHARPPQPPLR